MPFISALGKQRIKGVPSVTNYVIKALLKYNHFLKSVLEFIWLTTNRTARYKG